MNAGVVSILGSYAYAAVDIFVDAFGENMHSFLLGTHLGIMRAVMFNSVRNFNTIFQSVCTDFYSHQK